MRLEAKLRGPLFFSRLRRLPDPDVRKRRKTAASEKNDGEPKAAQKDFDLTDAWETRSLPEQRGTMKGLCSILKRRDLPTNVKVELPDNFHAEFERRRRDTDQEEEFSTLMSSYYPDSFDWSESSDYHGLDRILREFSGREKRLLRLCEGKTEAYADMLRAHEDEVRRRTITMYCQAGRNVKGSKWSSSSSSSSIDDQPPTPTQSPTKMKAVFSPANKNQGPPLSPLARLKSEWLFEFHHTLPVFLLMIFYCFSNMAFFNLVMNAMRITRPSFIQEDVFNGLALLLGLLTMRCTGYLWMWTATDADSYNCIKFDFHNRLRLGYLDARIYYFLRKASNLASILNMLSFYVCYSSIVHFYNRFVENVLDRMLAEWYYEVTDDAVRFASNLGHEVCNAANENVQGMFSKSLVYYLCTSIDELPAVAIIYDTVFCIASAIALHQLHFNFLRSVE